MDHDENSGRTCPRCGKNIIPDDFGGSCPSCLLRPAESVEQKVVSSAVLPSEDLQPWFPGLEILGLLGAGGMGVVYKARQTKLNRFVALKALRCPPESHADFALRFEREAQMMARLNHPHIVTIYEYGEIDRSAAGRESLFYFLMEYVDGSDLAQMIGTDQLSCEDVPGIVEQICLALEFAHGKGIAHRDLKPANLLVDSNGCLKVADFGLAKLLQGDDTLAMSLTVSGTAMGTPHYMAPEQWNPSATADHRSDIYSLGVVFYELLTKERPAGVFDPPSRKGRADPRIDGIVLKAMDRDPSRRYQRVAELREALVSLSHRKRAKAGSGLKLVRWSGFAAVVLLAGFGIVRGINGWPGSVVVKPPSAAISPEAFSEEWLIGTRWTFTETFVDKTRRTDFKKGRMEIFERTDNGEWTIVPGNWIWEVVAVDERKIRIHWYSGPEIVEISEDLQEIIGSKPNWKRFL